METRTSINLVDLIKLNSDAINTLHTEFKNTGWCLINLPTDFSLKMKDFTEKVSLFLDKNKNEKKTYSYSTNLGYVEKDFKQAFRWLSGGCLIEDEMPKQFSSEILNISAFFDSFFKKLLNSVSNEFFNKSAEKLAEEYEVPLLSKPTDKVREKNGYGMFDIVKYTSNKIEREMMVPKHLDPGIFSFSVYSNAPGLEMYDYKTNLWEKVPLDKGIIWCGVAAKEASGDSIKGAYHRVQPHFDYERKTFWYEVCVRNQILNENLIPMKKKIEEDNKSILSNSTTYSDSSPIMSLIPGFHTGKFLSGKLMPETKNNYFTINVNNRAYSVYPEMTVGALKGLVENSTGLSMSKMMTYTRLKAGNTSMNNNWTLKQYGLKNGDSITLEKSHNPF